LTFHAGAAEYLQTHNFLDERSPLAGASGGSLVACALACGIRPKDVLEIAVHHGRAIREKGAWWKMRDLLEAVIADVVPLKAVELCAGRLTVAVTRVWPHPTHKPILVDAFVDRDDLLRALLASCFVPGYLSHEPAVSFRGYYAVDGGLYDIAPRIPDGITVCPYWLVGKYGGIRRTMDICPHRLPDYRASVMSELRLLHWSFNPPEEKDLRYIFELGWLSAEFWAKGRSPHGRAK
jgi:hypothetical protein